MDNNSMNFSENSLICFEKQVFDCLHHHIITDLDGELLELKYGSPPFLSNPVVRFQG